MNGKNLLLGISPWIAFTILPSVFGASSVGWAAAIAGLGSLILAMRNLVRDRSVTLIDISGVATFTVLTILGFAGQMDNFLVDYGRGLAAAVLAAVMFTSSFFTPFTEHYARQGVDRRYWGSPAFRAVNRRISQLWAGIIAVMAVGHIVAGSLPDRPVLVMSLNWGLPITMALWALRRSDEIAGGTLVSGNGAA
jgi:hypothetical protein